MFQEIAAALVILVLTYMIVSFWLRPKRMPPGPAPLPIVGNLFTLISSLEATNKAHLNLSSLAKKYGDLFTLELPGQRFVVISSIARAREALLTKRDDFAGRPKTFVFDFLTMGSKDIAAGDLSPTLVLQRKIVHSAIRMYQPYLEEKVISEVNEMINQLNTDKPRNPQFDVVFITLNVIFQMAVGERFESIDDEEFKKRLNVTKRMTALTSPFNILNFLPFLIHFPLKSSTELKQLRDELHQYFTRKYNEHKNSYQDGVIRDLTDALIKARHDAEQEDSRTYQLIDEDHIVMTMMDVFLAGFETSSTVLLWFMFFLVNHPEVQSKIHEELDSVLGPGTSPRWKHRTDLPYMVATIDETLRKATIAPFLLPHKATKDSTLAGFNIPKGTLIMFNAYAMHHDENEWQNPDIFNPARFINKEGKVDQIAGSKSFLPFGMGKRVCVGEALAKQEIFVVGSRLLHQFTLHKASGSKPAYNENLTGAIHYPLPYEICFKPRQ